MNTPAGLRPASTEDFPAIAALIDRLFDEFVAADFAPEGISAFKSFISEAALEQRFIDSRPIAWAAFVGGRIAGYIELRGLDHISLLFVDRAYHRQGIAKALWSQALSQAMNRAIDQDPALAEFTVNASPFAVPVYMKLGFDVCEEVQFKDGFCFVPMRKQLRQYSI